MTTSLTAYTPLESLLLFQHLSLHGVEPAIFSKVSDLLNKNPNIRDADNYDSGRLSPDALREFYLRLLKEEVKSELHVQSASASESEGQNGEAQVGSRKRKAPSPSLPTVQQAAQHAHLIPQLISKLYARYRSHVVSELREEERRYDKLQKEIKEIEQGSWDDKLRREIDQGEWDQWLRSQGQANGEPEGQRDQQAATASQTLPKDDARVAGDLRPASGMSPAAPLGRHHAALDGGMQVPSPKYGQAKIESVINHPPAASPNGQPHVLPRPLPVSTPQQGFASPQQSPIHVRTPSRALPSTPRLPLPPPQPSGPGYRMSSPTTHQSPYGPSHPHPAPGPSQSPGARNVGLAGRTPSSPVILPPPPGMQFPPPPLLPSHTENSRPAYHGPPNVSPQQSPSASHRYPPPPAQAVKAHPAVTLPSPGVQHGRNYYPSYPGPQPTYPSPQHQQPPPAYYHPPHTGGIMLPPFQVTPQDPVRASQPPQPLAPPAPPATVREQPSPVPSRTIASSATRQIPPLHLQIAQQLAVYKSSTSGRRVPKPPPLVLPPRLTRWKGAPPTGAPDEPTTPIFSPIPSPLDGKPSSSQSPALDLSEERQLESAILIKATEKASEHALAPGVGDRQGRGGRSQNKRQRDDGITPAVASAISGRTRSQSVVSNAETAGADTESVTGRRVKPEPSTPAEMGEDTASIGEATPTSARLTRRRRGTLQSVQSSKRKRSIRNASEASDTVPGTLGRPQYVVAARNFPRMSNPVMNDISSHKHASLFSNPVKDKDAEGYSDMIRRPQDLKSIRSAVAAGARAVNAATADTGTPAVNSPGGAGGNVVLPLSEDLIPPKGIVNSAQLERELMRMFANAVMFNPGEEGVVQDAREMFGAVQESISNWRSAERTTEAKARRTEEEEGEEGAAEDGAGGVGKRRKV